MNPTAPPEQPLMVLVRLALIANHATSIMVAGTSAKDGIDRLVDLRNEIEVAIDQWERELEKERANA